MKTKHILYTLLCAMALLTACNKDEDDFTQTGEVIEIPDPAFRAYCLKYFDRNHDGKIREGEAAVVTTIEVWNGGRGMGIQSLVGIEHFVALQELECSANLLTSIDLSKSVALRRLGCEKNQLDSLDVSKNVELESLTCNYNNLKSLDLSNNPKLMRLLCYDNQISNLNLTNATALYSLKCEYNKLDSIDVSSCTNLGTLYCYRNNLLYLDISKNRKLTDLACHETHIAFIYVWPGWSEPSTHWSVPYGVTYVEIP